MTEIITKVTQTFDQAELEAIVPKKGRKNYHKEFSKTVTPEEKAAPSFLDWSDKRLGEATNASFMSIMTKFDVVSEAAYKATALIAHSLFNYKKTDFSLDAEFLPTTTENKKHQFGFIFKQNDIKVPEPQNEIVKENVASPAPKSEITSLLGGQSEILGRLTRTVAEKVGDTNGKEAMFLTASILMLFQTSILKNSGKFDTILSGLIHGDQEVSDDQYTLTVTRNNLDYVPSVKNKM